MPNPYNKDLLIRHKKDKKTIEKGYKSIDVGCGKDLIMHLAMSYGVA